MIIGGAFQGKAAFAEKKYPEIEWVNGADADWNSIQNAKGVVNFHEFIRAEMKKNEDVSDLAEKLSSVIREYSSYRTRWGYGVVPMDAFDRAYREAVGRICTKLAAYSDEVTRVVCGIGTVIKHD